MKSFLGLTVIVMLFAPAAFCRDHMLKGQLSGWLSPGSTAGTSLLGIRYMPEFSWKYKRNWDTEISANIFMQAGNSVPGNGDLKLYRCWARYYTDQFETRLGLQKINFGPARILRPLMWFDRLDPRDPLRLTDGVWGLLSRYYFISNANAWFWLLSGNDVFKGLEGIETRENTLECGGRLQVPVKRGEIGFSYHQRQLDLDDVREKTGLVSQLRQGRVDEQRIGVDGIWDAGVGLWFEASLGRIPLEGAPEIGAGLFTIGGDYTFDSGIHVLLEHLSALSGDGIGSLSKRADALALSVDYTLGLIDNLNGIIVYDSGAGKAMNYAGWQRTYDAWKFNLMVFANGSSNTAAGIPAAGLSGDGVQFLITFNH